MAQIELTPATLVIHIEGFDKILALRSRVEVPLAHVVRVEAGAEAVQHVPRGLRLVGTSLPGVIRAGSFYSAGSSEDAGWSFWDVHDPNQAVAIQLASEHYKWLVVGVDDPEQVAGAITEAIRLRG